MTNNMLTLAVTLNEMERMAVAIAKSNLFGMKTPEQALTLMLIAQSEGKHPASAARDYDIIQGRPAKKSEALLRDFIELGGKVDWEKYEDDEVSGTFSFRESKPLKVTWDMKRAERAGLTGKDNWKKYPRQMLKARVISEAVRMVCPGATGGLYSVEEVSDFDSKKDAEKPPKDVSPRKEEPKLTPPAPAGLPPEEYRVPFGKTMTGKLLSEIPTPELEDAVAKLQDEAYRNKTPLSGNRQEFAERVAEYLKSLDAQAFESAQKS